MEITEITVHAECVFSHPYESYANFRPGVTLKATIGTEESVISMVSQLQALADGMIGSERRRIFDRLQNEETVRQEQFRQEGEERRAELDKDGIPF